ncbi:hypothetical protein TUN199_05550 [Pyrenophora tritici-repentis]|nr:hypothetical protein PtrM4_117450 [Pyrenophora tritici-repentis]KAI0584039.1 hypothetical protein Alg130_05373 [Pyrenophora tritici-repentis]KAI0585913.1 hypothetical protein Alg215_02268 [Pyrenophora tritici-repentis]KAI0610447.1 hypothetical protein TUN205_05319 [Pyrenophora tritici-repentis]KAI0622445.1 hypothetical protein TUN199_05550 [Pyrenophora tritici-repentis]
MPDWNEQDLHKTLGKCVRQEDPSLLPPRPRHHFLIGACNETDERVRNIIVSYLPPGNEFYFRHVRRTNLEVRISRSRAVTPDGRRFLQRCTDDGVPTVLRGETDEECHESMLADSDYIINKATTYDKAWFLNNARVGVPQDSMLTNAEYDVSKHDASKHRLWQRYQGRGWRASSVQNDILRATGLRKLLLIAGEGGSRVGAINGL